MWFGEVCLYTESDEALIEKYNFGDIKAFDELYSRYSAISYNFVLRQGIEVHRANDVFQTVWIKIIERKDELMLKIKKSHPPFVFKAYMFTMLRNASHDIYRKSKKFVSIDQDELIAYSAIENILNDLDSQIIAEEKYVYLVKAIEALPPLQREIFLLIKEADFSLQEAASALGISVETAKTRRRYAYEKIRPFLEAMK
ncbi:MAG: RNA polymerase sigma factor (sigma-70 family) [Oleiphilaceae bacterium]|jgi:RNA polymerase sigma factor (sigma-70 family)